MSTHSSDSHQLERFALAQATCYDRVLAELAEGVKQTHWMWFVFPQIRGLGHSPMAELYAIKSREEAEAYLQHRVLGPRLIECTQLASGHADRTAHQIFGTPDDQKFQSCMTLFSIVDPGREIFARALQTFFAGQKCVSTQRILG